MKKYFIIFFNIFLIYMPQTSLASSMDQGSGAFLGFLKFIVYIMLFFLVIFISLYGTKFIAKNLNNMVNTKHIKNIDTANISTKSQINILEIDKYIYIILTGDTGNLLIDKIPVEDFDFTVFKDLEYSENIGILQSLKELRNRGFKR